MRKIIALLLALMTVLSLFVLPVSAEETLTDLKKVHSNLTTYLYLPYYEKSEHYDEYVKVMDELDKLLARDDITQEEISEYYHKIRKAYATLLQDTYDYTPLQRILDAYDQLDGTIFTEESWKKIISIRDSAKKELDAPTLFSKTDQVTEQKYTSYVNSHIRSFTTNFNNAFNRLVFVEKEEDVSKEYLSGFIRLIRFCAREELLGEQRSWEALTSALEEAEETVEKNSPAKDELNENFDTLMEAYVAVCNDAYDLSKAKDTLSTYHVMSANKFSSDSWKRYSDLANALEERLKQPHFFYIPLGADEETCQKYAAQYFDALPNNVNSAKETLIPMEDFEKLATLCARYKNKTSQDGLEIKLNFLKTRISEGEAVLKNRDATAEDVTVAIANIESAHHDLVVAEGHLAEEQEKIIKQDARTSRFTILFYGLSALLALGLAIFLSKIYYGRVDWSK